jgi:hypothetical protein
MLITAFFTDKGVPKTGLSPIISIYDLSTGIVLIDSSTMTERSGGFYIYDYVDYDNSKNYGFVADGGSSLVSNERYLNSTNETDNSVIDDKVEKILGLVHHNIYIDEPEYDKYDNMTSSRLRIYSNPNSVGSNANVISSYRVTSVGIDNGKFSMWKQVQLVDVDYLELEDNSGVIMLEDGNLLELG